MLRRKLGDNVGGCERESRLIARNLCIPRFYLVFADVLLPGCLIKINRFRMRVCADTL